jgi:hypothetical protein
MIESFFRGQDDQATDVISLGGINAQWFALDINTSHGSDNGWVAIAEIQFEGGPAQAEVVVPEPATIALLGLGMLALWRRR